MLYKRISIILVLTIILSLVPNELAYGEDMFTDVNERHWAKDYIEKMVNLGLMDGYDDATFRPNGKVSTVDTLVYITRLMNIPKDEIKSMRDEYDSFLQKFNLSEEEKNALAIGLSKKLITQKFIENNIYEKGKLRNATKIELTVYLVRAMGGEEEAKKKPLIFLYKDIENVPIETRPHVKYLIDKKILNEKGDGEGLFNPNQPITRDILAKMLYLTYEEMKGDNITTITIPIREKETIESSEEDRGHIKSIFISTEPKLSIINSKGDIEEYPISKNAIIKIEGDTKDIYDLRLGYFVELELERDEIVYIKVDKKTDEEIIGIIEYVKEDSRFIIIRNETTDMVDSINISSKVIIKDKDDRNISLKDLEEGDKVLLTGSYDKGQFVADFINIIE